MEIIPEKSVLGEKWLIVVLILLTLALVWKSFDTYYTKKNYEFSVEASCDPSEETCFVRDCEIDYCPPNGLSAYKIFELKAIDFGKCSDNSCKNECESGMIMCKSIVCGESEEDQCSEVPPTQEKQVLEEVHLASSTLDFSESL